MATAAQIEANRRNASRSTGPRSQAGKDRSKLNALVHGCRAEILVLPAEDPALYEERAHTWRLSLKPRNPAEDYIVERMASLAWKGERIDRAQMAQLSKRVHNSGVDAARTEQEQVNALGKRLLGGKSLTNDDTRGGSEIDSDADDPMHLILRLQTTVSGCQWMLDQWDGLRTVLEREYRGSRPIRRGPSASWAMIPSMRSTISTWPGCTSQVMCSGIRGRAVSGHHQRAGCR